MIRCNGADSSKVIYKRQFLHLMYKGLERAECTIEFPCNCSNAPVYLALSQMRTTETLLSRAKADA